MREPATAPQLPSTPRPRIVTIARTLAALALIGISFLFDAPVERWVTAHQSLAVVAIARAISRFSAWPWLMSAAAVCLALAWARRKQEAMRILIAIMIAASIAGLSSDILRGLTGRTRPYATPAGIARQGWYGVHDGSQWLVGRHAYNSFPSGHTTTITALSVTLLLYRRGSGLVLLLGSAVVAGTRVYLGAHHFSDVIAGAVLGTVIALSVWRWLMTWLLRRFESTGVSLER